MRPRQSSLGISGIHRPEVSRCGGFNEAEAIKPRNHPSRPPFAPTSGTSFNEAEAIKPRNRAGQQVPESERQGFNEAEAIKPRNRYGLYQWVIINKASMRPRQSSLGIVLGLAFDERLVFASMRPRQSSLGISPGPACSRISVLWLQ